MNRGPVHEADPLASASWDDLLDEVIAREVLIVMLREHIADLEAQVAEYRSSLR